MQNPQQETPGSVITWLESFESEAASLASSVVEDDAVLTPMAQTWRTGFMAKAAMTGGRPDLFSSNIAWNRRGVSPRAGGLGDDYPSDLFVAARAQWSMAARTLQGQQSMWPSGAAEARELGELAAALDALTPPKFAPTPSRVEHEQDGYRLRRMLPDAETTGEPIVVLAALINRWYVLDFTEGNSFLQNLTQHGRPVYVIESLPPEPGDERSFSDLCAGPLRALIARAANAHDVEKVSLVGYCTGGTLASIFAARYPAMVSRLATVCAPVQFEEGGLFARWFAPSYLDVELVAQANDPIPSWLVHLPFWWLRPTVKVGKLTKLAKNFRRPGYLEHFMALDVWNHDNLDLARGAFRSWVGQLYQRNELFDGTMMVDGATVRLADITCPLLVVSASWDAITPPAAAEPLIDASSSKWREQTQLKTGHVGAVTAPRVLKEQSEKFALWLESGDV